MIARWLQKRFQLTAAGAQGLARAAATSLLVHVGIMLPIFAVLYVCERVLGGQRPSLPAIALALLVFVALLGLLLKVNYDTLYTETYRESANQRVHIAETLRRTAMSWFSRRDISDLSQTIMRDVADLEHAMSHAIPQALGLGAFFALISIPLLLTQPLVGLALVLPLLASCALMAWSRQLQRRATTRHHSQLRRVADNFQEAIELHQEIRSYGLGDRVGAELEAQVMCAERIHTRAELAQALPVNGAFALNYLALGLTVLVGCGLYARASIGLLPLLGYLLSVAKLVDGFNGLMAYLAELLYIDARVERLRQVNEAPQQAGEAGELTRFDVELRDVEFGYRPGQDVVDGLSLTARQGEVTALVGPSGCGKTTLLRLISRLYDVDGGEIRIAGRDIAGLATEELFAHIAIVFQDVTLFNTSVLENIRLGRADASDEEVMAAARMAHCEDFIAQLPDGYRTQLGENGRRLSGGERQRLSIARAFLKDAPILLLDEISAALDVENERIIQENLTRLAAGRTVIIVSHRLKSIEEADHIAVLVDGRLEAEGRHEALVASSPTYRKMLTHSQLSEDFHY